MSTETAPTCRRHRRTPRTRRTPSTGKTPALRTADEDGEDAGPQTFPWMHATSMCFADTDHSWKGQHWAWDNGLNDGFYAENNGNTDPGDVVPEAGSLLDGERAMWWYDQTDIPFDYQLANTFAIGDNYFCSLLGPTGPNREYLMAATSFGLTYNSLAGQPEPERRRQRRRPRRARAAQRDVGHLRRRDDEPRVGPRDRRGDPLPTDDPLRVLPTSSPPRRRGRCRRSRGSIPPLGSRTARSRTTTTTRRPTFRSARSS